MSDHFRPPAIVSTSPDTVQRDVGSFQDAALGALFVGGKLAFPKVTSNTLAYINFALYEKSLNLTTTSSCRLTGFERGRHIA
ncbi:hypothetical protein FOMPIDRAFT_88442 [Fomitopsis schrenkii]|uniref:Uncharacterized protein n=1 Tax=Fomitopsis schrenkii TaxID=2126942 RepID=S8FB78_FOMSC|nr:hypothetical protein FOMPIDRAFT_88442 [Fomitopsis schrenkii]